MGIIVLRSLVEAPVFSVVVPTLGITPSLCYVLQSLSAQTIDRRTYEVIVVVDGERPDPRSFDLLRALTPFRAFYLDGHRGRNKARNVGIRNALGTIIVSLDGDMVASPDLLRHYSMEPSVEASACIGSRLFVQPFPGMTGLAKTFQQLLCCCTSKADFRDVMYCKTNNLREAMEPFWAFSTCNATFPKDAALSVGLFDEDITGWGLADQEFAYRLWKHSRTVFVRVPAAVAVHVEHPRDSTQQERSWESNRRRFMEKHGAVFADPRGSVKTPRTKGC